jgi:DNA-binding NarL/FixJ family response regulator
VPIRILIADDHAVVRSGLRVLLSADPDLEFVGEAGDSDEALRLVETLNPDMILLDISMPSDNGIETTERLKEAHPELIVLILTMYEDESLLREALRLGAAGYVVKRAEEAEIVQAIHAVSRGDIYVHPTMTRALLHQPVTTEHRRGSEVDALTPREIDVLRLLVKGNTNRQAAGRLGLSVRTVENHRANLMGKLGLSSRVELVSYAEEHDLIESSDGFHLP